MSKTVIRVSDETAKLVKQHAKTKGIELGDAAEALISTGHKRLSALASYNKSHKAGAKKAKKAAKKASKPKAKKTKAVAKPRPRKERPAKSARQPKAKTTPAPEPEVQEAVNE